MPLDQDQDLGRLRDILGWAPVVVYTLSADGRDHVTFISDTVTQMTGHPPEAFLDDPTFWRSHVHPDDLPRVLAAHPLRTRGAGVAVTDYRLRCADGSWRWIRDSARPRGDGAGGIGEIIGYWNDITAQKETEAALHDQVAFVSRLLETIPSPVYFLDRQRILIGCNAAFEALVGVDHDSLVGAPLEDALPGPLAADLAEGDEALLAGDGGAHVYEARVDVVDGQRHVILHKDRFHCADGSIGGLLCEITDITEFRAAQDRLTELVRSLEASNRDLEQFAYVAAHDLREPLRLVGSYLGLLKRRLGPALGDEGAEYIGYATDAVQRMNHLVQDLLRFAVAGRGEPAHPPRPLQDCLDAALTALRGRLDAAGATVAVRAPLPATRLSLSDGEQVFEHLLDNAVKYRHPDRAPHIQVEVGGDDEMIEIRVRDNGMGMEQAYADRVFQIFQRLHGWSDYPGTGIGLALAKKIIESHGGRIWLTARPGEGTCLHFTVPRAPG